MVMMYKASHQENGDRSHRVTSCLVPHSRPELQEQISPRCCTKQRALGDLCGHCNDYDVLFPRLHCLHAVVVRRRETLLAVLSSMLGYCSFSRCELCRCCRVAIMSMAIDKEKCGRLHWVMSCLLHCPRTELQERISPRSCTNRRCLGKYLWLLK